MIYKVIIQFINIIKYVRKQIRLSDKRFKTNFLYSHIQRYLIWNKKYLDNELGISDFSQNKLKKNELASVSFDTTIRIYDLDKLSWVNTLKKHTRGVWTCDYSEVSPLFATGANDNTIIIWDTNSYKPIQEIHHHEEVIYDVKFSANGNYLASCSQGRIAIWDLKNLSKPLSEIKGN